MERKEFGKRILPTPGGSQWQFVEANLAPPAQGHAPSADLTVNGDESFSIEAALIEILSMLFSFNGRINRTVYWSINGPRLFLLALAGIAYYNWLDTRGYEGIVETVLLTAQTEGVAYFIAFFVLSLCGWSIEVRRLHDRDISAAWIAAWFVPVVGWVIGAVQIFANGFFPGTIGPNRFDPD